MVVQRHKTAMIIRPIIIGMLLTVTACTKGTVIEDPVNQNDALVKLQQACENELATSPNSFDGVKAHLNVRRVFHETWPKYHRPETSYLTKLYPIWEMINHPHGSHRISKTELYEIFLKECAKGP